MDNSQEIKNALEVLHKASQDVIKKRNDEMFFGWTDTTIGDTVWFVKSGEKILELQKGVVIGTKTYNRRMWEDPKKGDTNKYTISTAITLVIETSGGIVEIDGNLAYSSKQDALLASICNVLSNYMDKE